MGYVIHGEQSAERPPAAATAAVASRTAPSQPPKGWAFCPTFTYAKPPENRSANHDLDYNEGIIPQGTAPDTLGGTTEPRSGKVDEWAWMAST